MHRRPYGTVVREEPAEFRFDIGGDDEKVLALVTTDAPMPSSRALGALALDGGDVSVVEFGCASRRFRAAGAG